MLATDFNGRGQDIVRVFIDNPSNYSCSYIPAGTPLVGSGMQQFDNVPQPTEFILFFLLKEFKMYIKF